jgi:hypothetical protein
VDGAGQAGSAEDELEEEFTTKNTKDTKAAFGGKRDFALRASGGDCPELGVLGVLGGETLPSFPPRRISLTMERRAATLAA